MTGNEFLMCAHKGCRQGRKTNHCMESPRVTTGFQAIKSVAQGRDFRVLWLAVMCSQIGLGMQQVLLGWVMLSLTSTQSMVGMVFAMRSFPNLLVGFAAGAVTDHLDRRSIMRLAGSGLLLTALILALLLFMERLHVWHLLLGAGMLGFFQSFDITARQVYVYDLLGAAQATQGIALTSLAQRCGGVVGSLIAGIVLEWWGAGAAFLVMSSCSGLGVGLLGLLQHRGVAAPTEREPLGHNLRAYVQELRRNHAMRSLMISTALAETLGFSSQVVLPILVKEELHAGAASLGVLTAFRFFGGMIGVGLLTMFGNIRRRGRVLWIILLLFGGCEMFLSRAPTFWIAALCVTCLYIMAAATDVLHHTLLQFSVANEQRGRAMGSWVVGIGTAPLGHLEIGYLAGLAGVRAALLINGAGLIVGALVLAWTLPQWRRL